MRKTSSLFPWRLTLKCFLSWLPERILVGDDLLPAVTVITGICPSFLFFFSSSSSLTQLWTKMLVMTGKQIECQLASNLSHLPRMLFSSLGSEFFWLKRNRNHSRRGNGILREVSRIKMFHSVEHFSSWILAEYSCVIPSRRVPQDLKWCINCFTCVDDKVPQNQS